MTDPKVSGKSRRWRSRMVLLQHALSLREALHRADIALDAITRILFEEEEPPADSAPPVVVPDHATATSTTLQSAPLPDGLMQSVDDGTPSRPSTRPTVYQPALRGDTLVQLVLRHWAAADTEDKRVQVRELANRCLSTDALTPEEYADLQTRMK